MFENIWKEFRKSLNENDWMEEKTLIEARKKLDTMKFIVGYPDELMDESIIADYYKDVSPDPFAYEKS